MNTINVLNICVVKSLFRKGKYEKFCEGSNQFCKGRQFNCIPLQNLLLPFASMGRIENKFRVFNFFGVQNFRTFTINVDTL